MVMKTIRCFSSRDYFAFLIYDEMFTFLHFLPLPLLWECISTEFYHNFIEYGAREAED